MKKQLQQSIVVYTSILGIISVSLGSTPWQEFTIEATSGDQEKPAVYRSEVVWQDNYFGSWQLMYRDLFWGGPTHIIGTQGDNINPAMHDGIIVWQARLPQYQDWDIYAAYIYNSTDPMSVDAAGADQTNPQVWGHRVVYQNRVFNDWDIGTADISDMNSIRTRLFQKDGDQTMPAFWGHRLVMQSNTGIDWDVLGMDVDGIYNGLSFTVNAYPNDQNVPAFHGDWAVWQDNVLGDWDIHGKNLAQPFESEGICTNSGSDALNPTIFNNVVVWQDNRNGNWDLYGYNLTTKMEFSITTHSGDQINPTISFSLLQGGYLVAWQDNRNGNWDIYGMILDGNRVAGCASPLPWDINSDCVVDSNDYNEVAVMAGEQNGISP